MALSPVAIVGAVYTASERGLVADALAARAAGLAPLPVCTSIVVASGGVVTDVNDVPVDTVRAQLEHLDGAGPIEGVKVGILGDAKTAGAVFDWLDGVEGPVVFDWVASGPSGETVLTPRGIDAVAERLGRPDLVTLSRADAELVTGGAIESLDDAQVAAQRLGHRGARRVLIRCGALPYRFYDAADDPGHADGDGPFYADLYYDGEDFALYEAPLLDEAPINGSSQFTITALSAVMEGRSWEEALQSAKRQATDALRQPEVVRGHAPRFQPFGDIIATR